MVFAHLIFRHKPALLLCNAQPLGEQHDAREENIRNGKKLDDLVGGEKGK
jgi:hypothetical protein